MDVVFLYVPLRGRGKYRNVVEKTPVTIVSALCEISKSMFLRL